MRGNSLLKRIVLLTITVGLLVASNRPVRRAADLRDKYHLVSRTKDEALPPEYVLTNALLGGFRGIFITSLWLRAQEMKNEGKYYEMVDIYNLITKLQPNHHAAWAFQAWDLTYNVSVEQVNNYDERIYWVFKGIDLLRLQGIPKNPNIPELYRELAWFFHHKIGGESDFAFPRYRAYLAGQMNWVLAGIRPKDYELLREVANLRDKYPTREAFLADPQHAATQRALRMIKVPDPRSAEELRREGKFHLDLIVNAEAILADYNGQRSLKDLTKLLQNRRHWEAVRQAALWTVGKRLKEKVNMDPRRMYNMCKKYGPIKWVLPEAHALYWGLLGQEKYTEIKPGPENVTLKYHRMCYPALMRLSYSNGAKFFGSIEKGSEQMGKVIGIPDYKMVDGVIHYMETMLASVKESNAALKKIGKRGRTVIGAQAGFRNYLKHTALNAYWDEHRAFALRMYKKLNSIAMPPGKWNGIPLQKFIQIEAKENFEGMNTADSVRLINSFLTSSYQRLTLNRLKAYKNYQGYVKKVYESCNRRWDKTETEDKSTQKMYEGRVPALSELQRQSALRLLLRSPKAYGRVFMARLKKQEPQTFRLVQRTLKRLRKERAEKIKPQ